MPSVDAWYSHDAPLPDSVYLVLVVGIFATFLVLFPFGLDPLPEVFIEGTYLVLVAVIAVLVRRTDISTLEIGVAIFFTGRLVGFVDELVVEPEPPVEPYLSGGLTVLGPL